MPPQQPGIREFLPAASIDRLAKPNSLLFVPLQRPSLSEHQTCPCLQMDVLQSLW